MSSQDITPSTVAYIASLANLSVTAQEQQNFATAFSQTLDEIEKLNDLDTKNVEPTHSVTGLKNVWREDEIDLSRQLTQEQALGQAKHKVHGFVVVDRVWNEE